MQLGSHGRDEIYRVLRSPRGSRNPHALWLLDEEPVTSPGGGHGGDRATHRMEGSWSR